MRALALIFLILISAKFASSIWCYRCVSSHPGCGLFDFDIRMYWGHKCQDPKDKCVKIIEQKGATIIVTRDCLSNIEGHKRDIPADRYEGCREGAADPLLAHYVNTSIKEHDVNRQYYDSTLYCFCDFDERCNGAVEKGIGAKGFFAAVLVSLLLQRLI